MYIFYAISNSLFFLCMLKKPDDGVAIRGFILGAGAATNNAKIREICDL
jgi:hypothetical protein